MTIGRSLLLVGLAGLCEIGACWLIWHGRDHRGLWWITGGVIALGAYGFVATLEPSNNFGGGANLGVERIKPRIVIFAPPNLGVTAPKRCATGPGGLCIPDRRTISANVPA